MSLSIWKHKPVHVIVPVMRMLVWVQDNDIIIFLPCSKRMGTALWSTCGMHT